MANKKIPMRQCMGCGEKKPKKELIRVVKDNEENIFLDDTGKKNGRGAYICKKSSCLKQSIKKGGLEKSFSMKIPSEIYEALEKEMEAFEK